MPVDNNNDEITNNKMTITNNIGQQQQQQNNSSLINNGMKKTFDNSKDSLTKTSSTTATTLTTTNDEMIKYFLKDFNDVITCFLCKGYLIDATTINECLHSFCKTCILKYFDDDDNNIKSRSCPKCDTQVHKTKPKLNIRSDPTRQDIVYKLVPGLYKNEMNRRKEFYRRFPEKAIGLSNEEKGEINGERLILSNDDQIQITIEYFPEVSNPFPLLPFNNNNNSNSNDENSSSNIKLTNLNQRRYLLVKSGMRVLHLKKFIQYKYELDPSIQVDFFYKHERLKDDYTIMDVAYIYSWRRNIPIPLYYLILEPNKTPDDYIWLNNNESKIINSSSLQQQRKTRLQIRRMSDSKNNNFSLNPRRQMRSSSSSSSDLLVSSTYQQQSNDTKPSLNGELNCSIINQRKRKNSNNSTKFTSKSSPALTSSIKSTNNFGSKSKINTTLSLSPCTTTTTTTISNNNSNNKSNVMNNEKDDKRPPIDLIDNNNLASKKQKIDINNLLSINSEPIITASKISSDSSMTNVVSKKQVEEINIENDDIPTMDSSNNFNSNLQLQNLKTRNDDTKLKRTDSISSSSSSTSSSSSSRSSSPMTLLNKIIKKVEESSMIQWNNCSSLSPKTEHLCTTKETNNDNGNGKLVENSNDQLPILISANVAIDNNKSKQNFKSSNNGDGDSTLIIDNNDSEQNSPSNSSNSNSIQINSILESLATIADDDDDKTQSNNNLHINGIVDKNTNGDTTTTTKITKSSDNKTTTTTTPTTTETTTTATTTTTISTSTTSSTTTTATTASTMITPASTTTTANSINSIIMNGNNCNDNNNNNNGCNNQVGGINDFQEFQKLLYEQINKATSSTPTATPSTTTTVVTTGTTLSSSTTTSTAATTTLLTKSIDLINNGKNHHHHHSLESSSS